jgi:hypothetical protein
VFYGGGGGGGSQSGSSAGAGGAGGGGNSGFFTDAFQPATSGSTNLGGGGGGGQIVSLGGASGNGGSGVVILRYPSDYTITIGSGLTGSTATSGSNKITTITAGSGNVSWAL